MNFPRRIVLGISAMIFPMLSLALRAENRGHTLFVKAKVFNVPRNTADSLLSVRNLQSNIKDLLVKVNTLVGRNEAVLVANSSLQIPLPGRSESKGLVNMHAELMVTSDKDFINFMVDLNYKGQRLLTASPMKRGEVVLLGSFDSPSAESGGPPGTNLVFVVIQ